MPTVTIQPNAVALSVFDWTGTFTDVDEGVSTHDTDLTYISRSVSSSELDDGCELQFENSTAATLFSTARVRVMYRYVYPILSPENPVIDVDLRIGTTSVAKVSFSTRADPARHADVDDYDIVRTSNNYTELWFETDNNGNGFTQAEVASLVVRLQGSSNISPNEHRVTAVEIVLEYSEGGGSGGTTPVSFSDGFTIGDSWNVSGTDAINQASWSEGFVFSESWTISRSEGSGGDDIVPGADNNPPARTDTACRSCGTFAQVTESLIFYADGFAVPVVWNGVSTNATAISGAKLLPYVVAHRDRVWLYGDEPYVTGTVQTTAGITTIQFSTAPPAGILSKSISISGVTFGTNEQCSAIVTSVNGVQATLSLAPNQSLGTANFIVFSGTAGATLQWSDENNHASWTDTEMAVGRLDGDIPTGIASVSGFLLLFKRTKTWRFDYGIDPSDINDRALVVSSETRGLVAHRCCVVVEGTAYCLDQFGSGAAWWITRGGALFPIEIGGDISDVTAQGEEYELDWSKSSCWFGVYEPNTNSIWWFCTRMGDNYPKVAFVYNRPSVEGGDEPGRWMIHEFDHPCIMGVTAVGRDGVMRAFVACADPDNEDSLYLAALSGSYGDMATSSQSGTVRRKISNTVLDLGLHTELHAGSLVEINGEKRTVESDDTVQVTFTSSWDLTVVENKPWKAGWKPIATFKSIFISPDPAFAKVTVSQVAILTTFSNDDCVARLGIESDGNTQWFPVLAGAQNNTAAFPNDTVMAFLNPGVSGYRISIQLTLESPGGDQDYINSVDVLRHKRTDPTSGWPSEMP